MPKVKKIDTFINLEKQPPREIPVKTMHPDEPSVIILKPRNFSDIEFYGHEEEARRWGR